MIAGGLVIALGCGGDDDGGAFQPVAIISAAPSEGPAPLTVAFDGSPSMTSSSSREYEWDLGDGTFDDRETFEHTYAVPGYYRVTLAVRDADRNAGTDSVGISVTADRPLSISGTVAAVPNQFTDSDTNNPRAPDGPNDEGADAQQIPRTPAIIGGFLAATPTGRPGDRFASSPDQADWYAIELEAGQTVQLAIADWVSADPALIDFDLIVGKPSGDVVASMGDGQFETVSVPEGGSYLIEVRAVSGFSNYTLSVGTSPQASSTRELSSSATFVPGEVLVRRGVALKSSSVATEPLGLEVVADGSEVVLARLPPATGLKSGGSGSASPATTLGSWAERLSHEQLEKLRTLYEVKRLRARADIDHAEPNYVLHSTLAPDDPNYPTQWHYPLIGLPQAWDVSTGSSSIIVAVVDTGVFLAHSDLQEKLIAGYDFIQDPARALDGDGIDPNPDDPGNGSVLELSSFHGTHVAGTVGGATDNELGVAGVSWGAQIMPVRVIGQGGATSFDVLEGVRYAAGLENTSGTLPPRRADVINLSLGGSPFSEFEQDVYTQVRDAGVIVISAAGTRKRKSRFSSAQL